MKWGKSQEHLALQRYVDLQLTSGHNGLVAVKAGFVICEEFPLLDATPDACVHDPSQIKWYDLVEIKCPYKYCDVLPEHAASSSDFCRKDWKEGVKFTMESCVLLPSVRTNGHH